MKAILVTLILILTLSFSAYAATDNPSHVAPDAPQSSEAQALQAPESNELPTSKVVLSWGLLLLVLGGGVLAIELYVRKTRHKYALDKPFKHDDNREQYHAKGWIQGGGSTAGNNTVGMYGFKGDAFKNGKGR